MKAKCFRPPPTPPIAAYSCYCSHEEFSLEGGAITSDNCITCPYHGAEFSLADGTALTPPAFEPIKTYPVRVRDGTVAVAVDE